MTASPTTVPAEVAAERDEILDEIEGRTLVDVFLATCDMHGARDALIVKEGDEFVSSSWHDYRTQTHRFAAALHDAGVARGEFVALMMTNRPEHVIADVAALLAGAVPVSVYNTLTTDQVRYIADDSGATVAIVENAEFVARWRDVLDDDRMRRLVVVEPEGVDFDHPKIVTLEAFLATGTDVLTASPGLVESCWRDLTPEDPATLIYTSGTTGPPKGVVLTHRNILFQLSVIQRLLDVQPGQRGISYLPLAHIAERMVTHYIGLRHGGAISFVKDLSAVAETMQHARPEMFMAVPRVWEKMYNAVMAKIDEDERKAPIAHKAINSAMRAVRHDLAGEPVPLGLRLQRALFDRLVFSKIRHGLGMDRLRYAVSGAAPISADLLTFYTAIGIGILEVYGLTETTAVATANKPGQIRIGTVGPALPGVEVRLADDGEILVRGPNVTPGYWRQPEATAELIDDDGWLHSGDLGAMDDDGYVTIVGRKKEIIITSGGKNISPANVEEAIKQRSPIIGQVCAVGDGRAFVAALIVLDVETLPGWCVAHGVRPVTMAQAVENRDILAEVQRAVDEANEALSRVEQVKQWAILPNEWTAESEELTPSMKLKRDVVHTKYADVIERLYGRV
ncbi:MAG: long-chain fatty acid--CoA ligase [Nitriliruptoraceae bacterium]